MRKTVFLLMAVMVGASAPAFGQSKRAPYAVHDASRYGKTVQQRVPEGLSAPGFDATYYALDLAITLGESARLMGRVRTEGRFTAAGQSAVELDLLDNMQVDSVRSASGGLLGFTHSGNVLTVMLAGPVDSGVVVGFDVFYQGVPVRGDFGNYVTGANSSGPYVWTLSEPYGARAWWPNRDHPSDKADSVDVIVRVQDPVRIGSNGLLVSETSHGDGTTTYAWQHRYPISSYLVFLAGGVYDVTAETYTRPDSLAARFGPLELPVLHYAYAGSNAYEGNPAYPTLGWKHVLDIFPVEEYWFGPYPFSKEKYGHAHVTFGGGMEHQTMSSMGGTSIGLISHELAHMWFGDQVTNRSWRHLWLHEGFATLAEVLYYEARRDLYPDLYVSVPDLYASRALQAEGTLVLQDTTSVSSMFAHSRVYAKGWMVLRMLRGMVGDEMFRTILQSYLTDPAVSYGTAETDDFRRVAQLVSGRDLAAFFSQWVTEGDGYPIFEVTWSKTAVSSGYEVRFTLMQVQTEGISSVPVFQMPVQVEVQTDFGPRRITVDQTTRTQSFTVLVDAEPRGFAVDPDRWILRAPDVLVTNTDTVTIPTRLRAKSLYPNPTTDRFEFEYELPETGPVSIQMFDATGRLVRTLYEGEGNAGANRVSARVTGLTPGVYGIRLEADSGRVVRTLVVLP